MAQLANVFSTYDNTGIREDLANIIENISPTDTPFMSAIGRTTATQTNHEWMTDTLAAASDTNAAIEGDESTIAAATGPRRLGNRTQISTKVVHTTTTNDWVSKAGRPGTELAYRIEKAGKELKRDMEAILSRNKPLAVGSDAAARTLASFETWIQTNDSRGAPGADAANTNGQPDAAAAPTDGTQRPYTEDLLKTVLQSIFTNGGEPSIAIHGPTQKRVSSTFTGNSTRMQNTAESNVLATSYKVYESDWGQLTFVPSRFNRDRSVLILDPSKWALAIGEDFRMKPLAETGLSNKRLMWIEYTLQANNEASSGIVADLS